MPRNLATSSRMGVHAPQQQRGREREQALIRAGLRLTETRDWDEVKVSDIAAEIGCSTGTFYTRFHNKDAYFDVLLDLLVQAMVRHTEAFHADAARTRESAAGFIAQWVHMGVQSFRQHRGLYATAMLKLRRLTLDERSQSPLIHLRETSRARLLQTMARHADWRTPAAQERLIYAHQLMQGVLINAVLTDPGPLHLGDAAFKTELTAMVLAYLGLTPPSNAPSPPSPPKAARPRRSRPAPLTPQETP